MVENRALSKIPAHVLSAVLIVLLALPLASGPAEAQEGRSFLDVLLGRDTARKIRAPASPFRQRSGRAKAKLTADRTALPYEPARKPATAAIVKNENARRILIVGDFVAGALAEGLNRVYSDNPDIAVITRTEGSSGFVRTDYYNWPARIRALITEEKPDVILVMLGANDRQIMTPGNRSFDILTPEWIAHYRNRILSFTETLAKSGSAWMWLSLPPFKQQGLNQSVVQLNALFKQAVEKNGGHFVDTWEGFVDESGNFAFSGYDINGQTARLRANDGINFTSSGRRKLAFYAEHAIRALFDAAPRTERTSDESASPIQPVNIFRITPRNIRDIGNQSPGLAGASFAEPSEKTVLYRSPSASHYGYRAGRADDFRLPQNP